MSDDAKHRYDDLLDLPHHEPTAFPRMSGHDRAAQFAPFAALTGYHDGIDETGRYTEDLVGSDELRQAQINEQLAFLHASLPLPSPVQITYFIPDDRKDGGRWHTVSKHVEAIDPQTQLLLLADGTQIEFTRILDIRTPYS